MNGILETLSRFFVGQMNGCAHPTQNHRISSALRANGGNTCFKFHTPAPLCSPTNDILSFTAFFQIQ